MARLGQDTGGAADKPAPEYRFPDFICIGAQKAGTTWLDKNLRRHPGLWLPPMKELQYFNTVHIAGNERWTGAQRRKRGTQLLDQYIEKIPSENWDYRHLARLADLVAGPISDDWYGRFFALAGSDQVCGEVTPDYSTLPEAGIQHILKLTPNVKIVFLMRDPIERSWSHLRMVARTRNITDVEQIDAFARHRDLVQRADYATIIANWKRFIPDERFMTAFLDEIIDTPLSVLDRVCGFLGVKFRDTDFPKAEVPIHSGEPMEMPPSTYAILKERLRPAYDGIAKLYPEIGASWSARHY